MYDENSDPHIQIAVDYNLKYKSRTTDIRKYLDHVSNLGDKFKRGQMYLDEMSQVLSYLGSLLYCNCVCIWSCFLRELFLSRIRTSKQTISYYACLLSSLAQFPQPSTTNPTYIVINGPMFSLGH